MTIIDIIEESQLDWKDVPGQSDEIKLCCPFCVERDENPDERYRLGVNIMNGLAHCFNCGWSSDDYLITARELARVGEVDMRSVRVTSHKRAPSPPKPKAAQEPVFLKGLPDGYERFNWQSSFEAQARNYLQGRGVRRDQIERWEIGWAMVGPYRGRIIIPVVMDGKLAGVVGRDYTGNSGLRYKNSESLRGVFGAKRNKRAILTEGAMDALRVEPLADQYKHDSIALFGSNLSDDQLNFLKRYDHIVVMPDQDRPGCHGARVNCEQIAAAGISTSVCVPFLLDGSDPGSQKDDLLVLRMRNAKPWSSKVERLLKYREAFG